MDPQLANFTDILGDEIPNSQPLSLPSSSSSKYNSEAQLCDFVNAEKHVRPLKCTGQYGEFRSVDEIDPKYKEVFSYRFFNLVQSRVIDDALYSDKSMVICAPTGSGKTVIFELAIVQLLMDIDDKKYDGDFKIIYMAPVKALCTERLTEWYPKFTKLGLLCIEVTGDTDVDFNQLKPYRIIITTPEKWDMLTRRWRDHRGLVEVIKLFLIDEVHILNDVTRGPVLEAVVSRMKTIEASTQSTYRIEQLQKQYGNSAGSSLASSKAIEPPPRIRFIAVSATVSNPEDVATWLGTNDKPAAYYKFGDECRPVALKRVVEGYPCADGTSSFKFDIILNYKLWPIIQKYHNGKPTLIFCNTRKSVILTAETLSRELTINFNPEQKTRLTALASTIKNKKLQSLILSGVGCHHAGLLYEERLNIEQAFRNRDLPILITTTTLAMGVNLPAHLVIIKNTQQYVNGAYQEYSISTVLQMVGRAGRPQFDTEATAVIMTRAVDKPRYESLVCGSEPLQSYLHKRLPENLNSEAALGTVNDVAQCVQWLRSTFLYVRAASDPRRYLGLPTNAPHHQISKKIEELCVRAMNGLATAGLITMDEASCIESTEAGRLMSIYYLDLETMKLIMKIDGTESLERLLWLLCESHELADMYLRVDERRCLNSLNRNNAAITIRFPMKGKISTRQMKVNCVIQATLGCLAIPDPSLNQEAMKIMRIADRVCKCLVSYVTRPDLISRQPKFFSAVYNSLILAKCIAAHLWENSPYVSKQLKGIGPTFSTLLATAGKINFMLLEESHPRDLERIMNKGAPAGNVLRKQIGLLPKYQITMTPIDEKVVSVQLLLLNHSYLSENMEHLTAGETHKSYLVAGDSENHILVLTSFKDKDLINVYDGCITLELTRKHNFEHKVTVHCISSNFVGIDAQCEYLFKDLIPIIEPVIVDRNSFYYQEESRPKRTSKKQTCITDTFKERKRKSTDTSITQSKEKKKRDDVLTEKIRILKESFGKASKELKEDLQKSEKNADNIRFDVAQRNENKFIDLTQIFGNNEIARVDVSEVSNNKCVQNNTMEEFEVDDFMDDIKINNILNEIESEIYKGKTFEAPKKSISEINPPSGSGSKNNLRNVQTNKKLSCGKSQNKTSLKTTNYTFIDLLEKNTNLNDEEHPISSQKDNYFSETIKQHINKYLKKTEDLSKIPNTSLTKLIENSKCNNDGDCIEKNKNVDLPVLRPLRSINTNIENDDTILDSNKQLTYVSTDSIMQGKDNDNEPKSEKLDKYNTRKENNELILKPNDTDIKFENIVVESPIKSINDIIDAQDVTHVRNTINEKVVEHNESEDIKTEDQTVPPLSLVPFEYSNSSVENNITDSRSRINEKHHNNLFNDLITNVKSTETEKSCIISTKQTIPRIALANDFPDWDIIQIDKSNKNPTEIMLNCNTHKQTLNTINDVILTVDNIATQKGHNDTKEDSYQNRYFHSTLNVNISTHNTEKHQIRLIKRLKVDLDITQIVTRHDIKGHTANDQDFRRSTSSSNLFTEIVSAANCKTEPVKYTSIKEIDNSEKIIHISPKHGKNDKETWPENVECIINNDKLITCENKLQSIFHKYDDVLRKKFAAENNTIAEPKNRCSENGSNPKIEKKKRPFKITDIHKIDIKLPLSTLTSEPPRIFRRIETQIVKEDTGESQTIDEQMNSMNHNLIEDHIDLNEMTDVCESFTPVPTADLISDNFKLDQSMFDPRTVLQCLSKDNIEIIPPPPQFSDANYSPTLIAQDNLDNEMCNQIGQNMCNVADFCELTLGDNASDLGDDETFLTPSTEIDSWLLTPDHAGMQSVEEPWTITHNNEFAQNNRHRDTIHNSRHANLNKFKFVNKKKLKI